MRFLDAAFVQGFICMAYDGWKQGWHERDSGNLSYRVKADEVELVKENFAEKEWQPIEASVPKLAGEYFLVTGNGKYFRNVNTKPEDSICMIELDDKGANYRIVWGLVNGGRPTSDILTHLMNHEVKMLTSGGKNRIFYYAHATNTIALTFAFPITEEIITKELRKMVTESAVSFPDKIGVIPKMDLEARDIAITISEIMKQYDVAIWEHHGMFASGEDFASTLNLMQNIEIAAEMLVKTLSLRQISYRALQEVLCDSRD